MKKILTVFLMFFYCTSFSFAQECTNEQKIENEKNYAGFNLEKSPKQDCGRQSINNKSSWFTVNIIINGKGVSTKKDEKETIKE